MPLQLPVDYAALRVTLVRAMAAALQLPNASVIYAEPEVVNAPRPAKPYCTLKFVTGAMRFGDDVPEDLGGGQVSYGGQRAVAVSFNCYGQSHEQALGLLTAWQCALDQQATQAALAAGGLAAWVKGPVADMSVLMNTGFEGRAHMDCTFGLAANTLATQGTIATVPVSGAIAAGGLADVAITLP